MRGGRSTRELNAGRTVRRLAGCEQAAGDLVSHEAAEGPAAEVPGAGRLGLADRPQIKVGHLFDPVQGRLLAVQTRRLEAVERLVRPQGAREIGIAEDAAASGMDHEQGRPAPARLDADERRGGTGGERRPEPGGEGLDGPPFEQGGDRESAAEAGLDA
jgi:hypothetical protein